MEDSASGIRAAHGAGMFVVAYPNAHYPPDREALALADVVVASPREIAAAVRGESPATG